MSSTKDTPPEAEHIRALNKINEDVASLLQTAGTAVKSLTTPPQDLSPNDDPLEARKAAYLAEAATFFTIFTRIRNSLGAEADALENAKLIPANPPKTLREDEEGLTNGGLGRFDVGWLNSRGDAVLRGKEKEVWAEVRKALEAVERRGRDEREEGNDDYGNGKQDED